MKQAVISKKGTSQDSNGEEHTDVKYRVDKARNGNSNFH